MLNSNTTYDLNAVDKYQLSNADNMRIEPRSGHGQQVHGGNMRIEPRSGHGQQVPGRRSGHGQQVHGGGRDYSVSAASV
jgi:hypothetical protein